MPIITIKARKDMKLTTLHALLQNIPPELERNIKQVLREVGKNIVDEASEVGHIVALLETSTGVKIVGTTPHILTAFNNNKSLLQQKITQVITDSFGVISE